MTICMFDCNHGKKKNVKELNRWPIHGSTITKTGEIILNILNAHPFRWGNSLLVCSRE